MRRPLRILLNALSVLSLVLCLSTAVLWVRSLRAGEEDILPLTPNGSVTFVSYHGRIELWRWPERRVAVPYAAPFIVFLAAGLPAARRIRFPAIVSRRMGRMHDGFCRRCGYDLRATPDRCPECGAVPSNANAGKTTAAP